MNESKVDISIDALRSGSRHEFARLVDAYSGNLYRLALKMLGNATDAEDALQNTFLQAFLHIDKFEGRSSLSTWLYRIASNESLMLLRKRHPETTFSEMAAENEDDREIDPVQFTDWCCLPEEELLSTEARVEMDHAIEHLPETLRIVFILRDIEGLSIQETSQVLGLSDTAVKTRLLRARLRLREELSSYFGPRLKERSKA